MLCDDGEIELNTPRDRENTFESQLIKKYQTRITQMDRQILSLYAKDMTSREIVATFKEMYDADICKRLVRTVLIFTESSDQLSRAADRVPGFPVLMRQLKSRLSLIPFSRAICATQAPGCSDCSTKAILNS